jgi:hypothetical protein
MLDSDRDQLFSERNSLVFMATIGMPSGFKDREVGKEMAKKIEQFSAVCDGMKPSQRGDFLQYTTGYSYGCGHTVRNFNL